MSTTIITIFILSVRRPSLYRRQILTYKDGPRAERGKPSCQISFLLTVLRLITTPVVGGGPRVVDSTVAFHTRVRGSVPGLGGLKETKKCFFPIHVWKSVLLGASLTEK